jgi:serine/threonine protein phosphatase 1
MVFVIGDIHGEYNKLVDLITNILKKHLNPTLVFLGDYINKGTKSLEVLEYLSNLSSQIKCHFLWGNHEYSWFNLLNDTSHYKKYLSKYGGIATCNSFNTQNVFEVYKILTSKYLNFFKSLQKYYIYKDYIISHSGISEINLDKDLEDIPLKDFLFNRYDFLNSSYCYKNFKFIFGHTGFYYPYVDEYKIGIDTGACYLPSQSLTSFCIDDNYFLNSHGDVTSLNYYKNLSKPSIIKL